MRITYNLPHVFAPDSNRDENAYALRASLLYLITLNYDFLRFHTVPDLYQSGVVYGRTQIWESIPALYMRGAGDCKSLTACMIAQYRRRGIHAEPVFRWDPNVASRVDNFHILVETEKGYEDPSRVLGMGRSEFSTVFVDAMDRAG